MLAGRMGVVVALAGLNLAPMAWADGDTKAPPTSASSTVTMTASVTAIDIPGRIITLKGPKGNSVTFHVGEAAKNFDQIKVGDNVVAHYYESYALKVTKPGAPGGEGVTAAATAPAGQMPAGAVVQSDTIKAKVTAIGKHKDWVTLKGPEGNSVTIKVHNPKHLDGVKIGDDVEATYTQALAVAVDRAPPARK